MSELMSDLNWINVRNVVVISRPNGRVDKIFKNVLRGDVLNDNFVEHVITSPKKVWLYFIERKEGIGLCLTHFIKKN